MSDMSERQFAKHVGASLSAVQDRRKAGLLPRSASQDAKGRWRIDSALGAEEWVASAPLRVPKRGDDSGAIRAWREARARREMALAKLAEDDLLRRRGELVEVAGVEAGWAKLITEAKTKLLGIPSKLGLRAPHLARADIVLVDDLIREALEALADGR